MNPHHTFFFLFLFCFCGCQWSKQKPASEPAAVAFSSDYTQWTSYLGGPERNHFSTLSQITPENVGNLQVAWTYATPDSGQMQMNPIIVEGTLYGITATLQAFALEAATGKELWRFGDPGRQWHSTSRGVAYWANGADKRILFTAGSHLFALEARTGQPIQSFGKEGKVDLHTGLPEAAQDKFIISNTPGTVFENLIIMPVRVSEGADAAPGDIRAFDVVTGELVWTFHTIPHPGEPGYETWEDKEAYQNNSGVGGANNWAGMALDEKAGILYAPTGSLAPDFYGGNRLGSNLYANCLLALNARTGERIWHYQFVHHDIWDRDPPAPPNLILIERDGQKVEAVAQVTKQGYVFAFDRHTGQPLFEIREQPFPASTLEGERAWATQPVPVKPKPFARQSSELTENDISPYATNREELLETFRKADRRLYAPPATTPVLLLPGYDGGAEWGGAAADPTDGILYVNANEMPWLLQMEAATSTLALTKGETLYQNNCAGCHQKDRKGRTQSGYPALTDMDRKLKKQDVHRIVTQGKGMMPGFPHLKPEEKTAIIQFLYGEEKREVRSAENIELGPPKEPFRHTGYNKFLDQAGLPAIAPPWGTLHAINLNSGDYLWSVTLGETESLKKAGFPQTGTENYGGPLVTENGLLFIAATKDGYFRAYHKRTGKLLWETKLPAAAFATPATYQVGGKQFVVIACGGEKLGTPKGNKIVAFALE